MLRRVIFVIVLVLWPATLLGSAVFAVEAGFVLPPGDPAVGRTVFMRMQCNHCHMVSGPKGARMAMPTTSVPAPLLDAGLAKQDVGSLVTSIIAPSHKLAPGTEKSGTLSPMGDYSRALTVRERIDLVAFLRSLEGSNEAVLPRR